MSPTQRSLAYLRAQGYTPWITEHWHAFARRRVDLYGFIDILAIRPGEVLGVQTTSAANVSARVRKIGDSEYAPKLREAGIRLEVHGWAKGKPEPRIVDVS